MSKENILLVLWILFGFLFITALNSILYFTVYLVYFGLYEMGVSHKTLKVLLPIITIILYILTTYILIKRGSLKSKISGIYLMDFPIKLTVIIGVIALAINPITKKLTSLYTGHISAKENWDGHEFLEFFSNIQSSFFLSKLVFIIVLLVVFLTKLKHVKISQNTTI